MQGIVPKGSHREVREMSNKMANKSVQVFFFFLFFFFFCSFELYTLSLVLRRSPLADWLNSRGIPSTVNPEHFVCKTKMATILIPLLGNAYNPMHVVHVAPREWSSDFVLQSFLRGGNRAMYKVCPFLSEDRWTCSTLNGERATTRSGRALLVRAGKLFFGMCA